MVSEAYTRGGQSERAGGFIIACASVLAAVLVIAALIYAPGSNARSRVVADAAGCEPSLFISGLPCLTKPMLASRYTAIATPVGRQLATDMAEYTANETRNLSAAKAALTAEVATEQAFDKSLAAVTFTPQNMHTADVLIQTAFSNALPVPSDAAIFTPQISAIANALIKADQALATLTSKQARSTSLRQLRSFNRRHNAAQAAVAAQVALLRRALGLPPLPRGFADHAGGRRGTG